MIRNTVPLFVRTVSQIFQVVPLGCKVRKGLVMMHQVRSVLDYVIKFCKLDNISYNVRYINFGGPS